MIASEFPFLARQSLREAFTAGLPWKGEIAHTTKSGAPLWSNASILPVLEPNQTVQRCILIAIDITEKKAVELALESSREFLKKLMDHAPVGFFLADREGQCVYINTKWTEITGARLRAAMGSNWTEAIHPDDRDKVIDAWSNFINGNGAFLQTYRYRRSDGEIAEVFASSIEIASDRDGSKRFLRVELDVTDERRNQRLVDEQRSQLLASSKLSSLGEMASGIAHEINNPLAIILGRAQYLKDFLERSAPGDASASRAMDSLIRQSERIAKIIKSMRTIARDADRDPIKHVNAKRTLTDAFEACAALLCSGEVEMSIESVPNDIEIRCRPVQLTQVLLNLVGNSVHATKELNNRWVRLETRPVGDRFEILVTDSGHGLSAAVQEKIFQPFFTTKTVGEGMGLGLSVSKGMMRSFGGDIYYDPNAENTRFVIVVPATRADTKKTA